jgi:hypothetical protein
MVARIKPGTFWFIISLPGTPVEQKCNFHYNKRNNGELNNWPPLLQYALVRVTTKQHRQEGVTIALAFADNGELNNYPPLLQYALVRVTAKQH